MSYTKRKLLKFNTIRLLVFMYEQRFGEFAVPGTAFFESERTTTWLTERLKQSKMYLEFGSGGSTYLAAKLGIPFITIDSDNFFLGDVRNKIIKNGFYNESAQKYIHRNIGLTEEWGTPIIFLKIISKKRRSMFAKYSDFPLTFPNTGKSPDLILIDGRFRVACALKAINALKNDSKWMLIIDDYIDRPFYKAVEQFAKLDYFVGRMAVFSSLQEFDESELTRSIKIYEQDWR